MHLDLNARRKAMLHIADAEWFQKVRDDETFYDVKVAGYWVYVLANWIGSGADSNTLSSDSRKRPHLKIYIGINAPRPHLMDGQEINTVSEHLHLLGENVPLISAKPHIYRWFRLLASILSHTRILCCDWTRMQHYMEVPERKSGVTAIFFDLASVKQHCRIPDAAAFMRRILTTLRMLSANGACKSLEVFCTANTCG